MPAQYVVAGPAVSVIRDNVDTDIIIPSKDMSQPGRSGLGRRLFSPWRYLPSGEADERFVLNRLGDVRPKILVTGRNFGCGSSREYAVWALVDYGFECVIAKSFGNIFHGNCLANGVLPIILDDDRLDAVAAEVGPTSGELTVDVGAKTITGASGRSIGFELDEREVSQVLSGDQIEETLRLAQLIDERFERDRRAFPWKYSTVERRE